MVDVVTVLEDGDDATAIADALSRDGWHVVSLGDGHEAVRRLVGPLADLVAHVVVLDADADGLDAVTVLHRLKRAGVPSEVLVAARTSEAAAEAVSVGAAGAVPKPLVPDHVNQVVGETLARLGHQRHDDDLTPGAWPAVVRRGEDDADAEQAQRAQWRRSARGRWRPSRRRPRRRWSARRAAWRSWSGSRTSPCGPSPRRG